MGEIAGAIRACQRANDRTLTVSVAPVFASRWLVSRLGSFYEGHPDVKLRIDASLPFVDLVTSDIDACIRSGRGPWAGVTCRKLSDQTIFPVCSPATAQQLKSANDLFDIPILKDASDPDMWTWWAQAAGVDEGGLQEGTTFSDATLCMDAAIAGQGVYMAVDTLVQDQLRTGSLVPPFEESLRLDRAYWLLTPTASPMERTVGQFGDWLDRALRDS